MARPRKITHLVIHCSASPRFRTTPQQIRGWHLERGWSDVGYHKIIVGSGDVYQGRPDEQPGAHAEGFNGLSLGICLTGNFDLEPIAETDPQFLALVQVCAILCQRHKLAPNRIIGHRDVYPILGKPVAKTCPGKHLYALLPKLRERVAAYLKGDK